MYDRLAQIEQFFNAPFSTMNIDSTDKMGVKEFFVEAKKF